MKCPLCRDDNYSLYAKDRKRNYFTCHTCSLVFAGTDHYISNEEEKKLYDFHQNTPDNQGYCDFLNQLINPLVEKLSESAKGLDYGCGPGPTLNLLLKKQGYEIDLYDPFYKDDRSIFEKKYDFVTSTEVFEHLQRPDKVLNIISNLLKEKSSLGIMTKLYDDSIDFKSWYYKNDMTHIVFYRRETIDWISKKWNFEYEIHGDNVIIFTRK